MERSLPSFLFIVLFAIAGPAQSKPGPQKPFMPRYLAEEDHQASIYGIKVGMTTPEVLEKLGGRMPDKREDKDGEIIVYWKTEEGLLQLRFRDEDYVSYVGLQYAPLRPTNDFWLRKMKDLSAGKAVEFKTAGPSGPAGAGGPGLVSDLTIDPNATEAPRLSSSAGTSALTGTDPRLHREYKVAETVDKERTVWTRQEKREGYNTDMGFISADRKKKGEKFEEWIQFKYLQVSPEDLKRFDRFVRESGRK